MSLNNTNTEIEGLYLYGSGEMDQLSPIKEDEKNQDIFDTKIPIKIPLHFISPQEKIKLIKCGQMFTMILSTEGNVYTFGCADNGGIGHEDSVAAQRVNINFRPIGISGGDCHGVAYNENNLAFWGQFRNSQGGMGEPCLKPKYYTINDIQYEHFKKVISGTNHVIILSKEKNIYAIGNKEFGQRGINPNTNIQHLEINKINEYNVEDIFTGDEHSFLVKYEKNIQVIKSWGLNSRGQLGIGIEPDTENANNIFTPTKVKLPPDVKIKKIIGGNGNSICITEDNRIFIWGNNEDNLLGLNDNEIIISTPKEIQFFNKYANPDNEVDEIIADYQSFYARNTTNNKVYSWGSGDSYILGNKKERSEKKPYLIDRGFFKNLKVIDLDMGCAHVAVVLTQDERLNNIVENRDKAINITIGKTVLDSKTKPRKRKNDDFPDENGNDNNINNIDDNYGVIKTIQIKNEFITLYSKDKPKSKAKIIVKSK